MANVETALIALLNQISIRQFSYVLFMSSSIQILYTGIVIYAPALALNQGKKNVL